jgi:hypothetical protein
MAAPWRGSALAAHCASWGWGRLRPRVLLASRRIAQTSLGDAARQGQAELLAGGLAGTPDAVVGRRGQVAGAAGGGRGLPAAVRLGRERREAAAAGREGVNPSQIPC